MANNSFQNPFRPGAGHMPPYLAGRSEQKDQFNALLKQDVILDNLIITGLRGVGKTVLMESLRPLALEAKWAWVGTELSETTSVTEASLATRIITDLSVITSNYSIQIEIPASPGFTAKPQKINQKLDYTYLVQVYNNAPGLVSDKLKAALHMAWRCIGASSTRGVIFAYDEAQTLVDHAAKEQYPFSLLLDVFQSIQKAGLRFMLVLTGLPTLFPKLIQTRTYAERMFRVLTLGRLNDQETKEAIEVPIKQLKSPVKPATRSIALICTKSGGYPYFIQFICREVFDVWINNPAASVPIDSIISKLDTDFFYGRWARATDRQRDLLLIIASLPESDGEFSVSDIVTASKESDRPFSSSHVNQMLGSLSDGGLVYKNRHGKYAFAVPMLDDYIRRQAH
ncbi:AAA family ATPase [Xanthomonas arboricola]|uniref:AAA family ATPase n=1 Tax=Xanthomonas arboricola TaxID=56448 RepID=UPI003EC09FB9